jgi:hypothetical protein
VVVVAEDDLIFFGAALGKEGDGTKAEIRRFGKDGKDAVGVFIGANDDVAAVDVTALPLDDELAGEVLPHEQKGGDDEPAEEQHETRHQQPMEEDAEGDKGEAKGVDTEDFKGTGKPRLPKIVTALTRRWYGWRDFPAIPSIAGGFCAWDTG